MAAAAGSDKSMQESIRLGEAAIGESRSPWCCCCTAELGWECGEVKDMRKGSGGGSRCSKADPVFSGLPHILPGVPGAAPENSTESAESSLQHTAWVGLSEGCSSAT